MELPPVVVRDPLANRNEWALEARYLVSRSFRERHPAIVENKNVRALALAVSLPARDAPCANRSPFEAKLV
jgi:hypothetical protein